MWEHFNETERKFIVGWLLFACPENFNQTVKDLVETYFPNNPKMLWATIDIINEKEDLVLFYNKFDPTFLEELFKANPSYLNYSNDARKPAESQSLAHLQEVKRIKAMLENGYSVLDSV